MHHVIILHHHEIVLKGENRKYFEKQLLSNVRTAVRGIVNPSAISGGYGRFILQLNPTNIIEDIIERLSYVFGLANICQGLSVEQNVEMFCQAALKLLQNRTIKTIKVVTRRIDKNFPTRSMEVNRQVGEFLCKQFHVRANLSEPDETIFIDIVNGAAYVYRSKIKGAGGLPSSVSGKVISLLSAGFDSPVASWQIMKRGASVIFVHFHSMPYTSQNSIDQVKQLVEILTRYQFDSKLYLVPFLDVQNEIVLRTPQPLRVILYRRMMIRIAEAIARKEKAEALVTGEAVGQVASQTLRNIRNIDQAATYPVLRPLSGMDKEETIVIARKIKTHDISKEPYDDCCSFLAPHKPETWSSIDQIEDAESNLDIQVLLDRAINESKIERYYFPPTSAKDHVSNTVTNN